MYDPVLLATFLAVAETRSFTAAAARRGLSQPTVSQQVPQIGAGGRPPTGRSRHPRRAPDRRRRCHGRFRAHHSRSAHCGEQLFHRSAMRGRLRFGTADDLAITELPRILRHFRQLNPEINLELTVDQSAPLYRRLKAGQLDLIFIKRAPDAPAEGTRVTRDSMVWMGQAQTMIDPDQPVPLITYQGPSISRQISIPALEEAGRTWRVTCNTREVSGVLAAVRAGLGVAIFPQALIPGDLMRVSQRFALPELGAVDFTLLSNPLAAPAPVAALTQSIMGRPLLARR